MGIPTFFRKIINDYPDTIKSWQTLKHVDYFYIDFNAIVYNIVASIDKKTANKDYEKVILANVNAYLQKIICEIVKPQKGVYIAFDGSVPRAKMIQQRFRRFKGVKDKLYFEKLKEKHGIEKTYQFDTTVLSPGTEFMDKMSKNIASFIKKGELYKHKKITITLSDTLVPGEGEHKFMPEIRKLVKKEPNAVVVVQSPDADVIVLSISTHKENIYVLRSPTVQDKDLINKFNGQEFLYLDVNKTKEYFTDSLTQEYNGKIDTIRHMTDFVFITFLMGNDFVVPAPYLKVKSKGQEILTTIYKRIFGEREEYLVNIDGKGHYKINIEFLTDIIGELAQGEDFNYQGLQKQRDRKRKNPALSMREKQQEADMSEYEKARSRYEHQMYYSVHNPMFEKYNPEFDKINYFDPKHKWKEQYYKFFFNIDNNGNNTGGGSKSTVGNKKIKVNKNKNNNNNKSNHVSNGIKPEISNICMYYLKTLIFNLEYYFTGTPPSWRFFYPHRAAPVMSDLHTTLMGMKTFNSVNIFEKDEPFLPFEQLMLILPPQTSYILPKNIGDLMSNIDEEIIQYYPIDFELDAVLGGKHVYAEPILPVADAEKIVDRIKKEYPKLSDTDKKRNVKGKIKKFIVK